MESKIYDLPLVSTVNPVARILVQVDSTFLHQKRLRDCVKLLVGIKQRHT